MRYWSRVFLLLLTLPTLDAANWIKIRSENFTLYASYTEDEARQTLETFEQTRDFFRQVKAFAVTSESPLVLIGFRTQREYRPYSRGLYVKAYFTTDEDRDYIVMSDPDEQGKRISIHEYVHALVRHSGLSIPSWLNEGLAEVYSGMEAREGKMLLGRIPSDRAYTLGSSNWMRLRTMIGMDPGSIDDKEPERGALFYAQSCLLAHMLLLGDGYSSNFSGFLERISATRSTETAFAEIYGKPLAEVERDMRAYFQQPTIGGAALRAELSKVSIGKAAEASEVEVGLTLSKLLNILGRPEEALHQLQRLPPESMQNIDVQEAIAYTESRMGHVDAALEHFQAILSRSAAGWRTYWDYGSALDSIGRDRTAEFQALRKALELKPDLLAARLMLGTRLCEMGQFAEGLEQLEQIGTIDTEHAAPLYLTMAYAALELKQPLEAREYAGRAKRFARKADETDRAEAILQATGVAAAAGIAAPAASPADDDPGRPILRRQTKKQERLR